MSPTQIDEAIQRSQEYVRAKYSNFGDESWADIARGYARSAPELGISLRCLLACLATAHEQTMEKIFTCCPDDRTRASRLAAAVLRMAVIEAEIMYSALADDQAEQELKARQHNSALFEQKIVSEVDSASRVGEGLREQAKDASAATRGMLGKASEVAAAAEQSALAMREAALTSAGLIRAIEDARTEVESAAEVAMRAPNQAGDAVAMSTTPSERSEEHTSELQTIMRTPSACFRLKKKKNTHIIIIQII